jgi:copper chaperone
LTTELRIRDASCGHCKTTIEAAVSALEDIKRVELDLETKRLTVEHGDKVGVDRLTSAIRHAGYTAEPMA